MGRLVLTRRPNESILIGDNIEVRIMKVHCKQVSIAITAPPEICVDREEVRARIRKEMES